MIQDKPVKREFFKLKNDILFKAVFANPNKSYLLERLIKEIIKEDIKIISIKPTELPKNNINIRNKILDIIATSNGTQYNIELNSVSNNYFRRRNASYIFKLYADSVLINESYDSMDKFIQINLTDSNTQKMPLISKYGLVSLNNKENMFIDNLEIYEIDISKKDKLCYNENGLSVISLLNMSKEELENIHGDEIMEEIKDKAIELNNDEEVFKLMSDEKEAEMIWNTMKHSEREKGIEKGKKEAKTDIAKQLINKNISIEEIIEITGLTKEEIDKLN